MNEEYRFWTGFTFMATVAFCTACFFINSCQVEENKLKAKCIEAKGMWQVNSGAGQGGCVVR
jgi:hypothetical protein